MDDEDSLRVGMSYAMPFEGCMEIRASKPIDDDVAINEEIEGVKYNIYWNYIKLPWYTITQSEATAFALGCQCGAHEILKMNSKDD